MENHIAILIPSNYGSYIENFTFSLLQLQQYFYEYCIAHKRDDKLSILKRGGYSIDDMRNGLVEIALENEVTHLLFLDTDMSFPQEIIPRMLGDLEINQDLGLEAVTGLYTRKSPPFLPHVYPKFKNKSFVLPGIFPLDRLFKVEGAGCGCLMVKAEVFKRVKPPWFLTKNGTLRDRLLKETIFGLKTLIPNSIGEDLYFCLKARPVMVCDPSIQCEHYHITHYGINDYIDSNGLKRIKGGFKGTNKQIEKIGEMYDATKGDRAKKKL